MEALVDSLERNWGSGVRAERSAPSLAGDDYFRQWQAGHERNSASPGAVLALLRMNAEIDVRHVLPAGRVPTLILHRRGDRVVAVEHGRHLAAHISGAKYVELAGTDHAPFAGDANAVLDETSEFLTGVRLGPEPDRVLATVLFTDIVGATERAAALGDHRWGALLAQYHALVRQQIQRHRGHEVDTAGDGFLVTFDGPARAVRCAIAVVDALRPLSIRIRAGLHTGECEMIGEKVGGIAVHIGARVAALAAPDEILVSGTVKDLVAGSRGRPCSWGDPRDQELRRKVTTVPRAWR